MEDAEAMEDVEESPASLAAADGAELGIAENDEAATEDCQNWWVQQTGKALQSR